MEESLRQISEQEVMAFTEVELKEYPNATRLAEIFCNAVSFSRMYGIDNRLPFSVQYRPDLKPIFDVLGAPSEQEAGKIITVRLTIVGSSEAAESAMRLSYLHISRESIKPIVEKPSTWSPKHSWWVSIDSYDNVDDPENNHKVRDLDIFLPGQGLYIGTGGKSELGHSQIGPFHWLVNRVLVPLANSLPANS